MAYYSVSSRNGKYCCQVRWTPEGETTRKSKNKTFVKKAHAVAWGKLTVSKLEESAVQGGEHCSIAELIDKYLNDPHTRCGRSKVYSLKLVQDSNLGRVLTSAFVAKHIVDFCKDRKSSGARPSTISCDVSNLRAVLKAAEALYGICINESPIVKAMPTLHALHLVGKSSIRTRRPEREEVDQLLEGLKRSESRGSTMIPYSDIFQFSILSCMRIGEVCSIVWDDFNQDEGWVWVRDRKDPRKKIGNHMKVPLLGGAADIAARQPRGDDSRIFPYNSRSVTTGFRRVRNEVGIEDLRYHDLRREGASRLFEEGYSVDEVAQVTGHRDLNTLWRIYTSLNPDRVPRFK